MVRDMATVMGKHTLPSGPATLCFNKEEFMKESFNVDHFVLECKRRVPLETLRDDLHMYLKILQTAMIELINKDYADFVNLSTNLVGLDKAINNLTTPLGQLKEEVLSVRCSMDEAIAAVQEKQKQQTQIKEDKACLQRLMNIIQSVEKIEKLLGIHTTDSESQVFYTSELSGQLIERVATEFNKLQFYVNKSRGLHLVEQIKPRITNITTTLQYSLEDSFKEGLEQGQVDVLRQCLRTYATIDKMKDAESLFRQHIVKPNLQEVITEEFIRNNPQGLKGMYKKILEFIPKHCKRLKEVTSGSLQGVQHSETQYRGGEVVRGYDFLVNAVWPEVVSNVEARTPSIFAPGNPNVFHEKYLISMEFLERFEKQCGSQGSVKRLRAHPSYNTFMTKWSLPVYFQIRFQEIAGSFETSLSTPFNKATGESVFHLHCTEVLWDSLHRCWRHDVFLAPLSHRLWKLSLQLLARYASWIDEVYQTQLSTKSVTTTAEGEGTKNASGEPMTSQPVAQPPVTMGQLVCVIADAQTVTAKIPKFYTDIVQPKINTVGFQDHKLLQDCLEDSQKIILDQLPRFGTYITTEITNQCAVHLKLVNDIPRLYRRTNREVPSKASAYVSSVMKPLQMFIQEHKQVLHKENKIQWTTVIVNTLAEQYHGITSDVLTSVKKMEESLKRLKKARTSVGQSGSQGMTDDDKIRLQLSIDVTQFGNQIDELGIDKSSIENYVKLHDMKEKATNSSSGNT